jgi:transketolase
VTSEGDVLGIDRYGESGPGEQVLHEFGFTVENVCRRARALLQKEDPA